MALKRRKLIKAVYIPEARGKLSPSVVPALGGITLQQAVIYKTGWIGPPSALRLTRLPRPSLPAGNKRANCQEGFLLEARPRHQQKKTY